MRKIQLFKLKFVIGVTFFVLILNSYLWYQLSLGFFDVQARWFLMIMFNQIFFGFGLVFIYFIAKLKAMEGDYMQMKYIIKKLDKKKPFGTKGTERTKRVTAK